MTATLPEKREIGRLDFLFQRKSAYDYLKDRLFRRAFPEVGKIKIGKRVPYVKDGQTLLIPQKEDRFIITKTIRGEDGNFIPDTELMKIIAEKTGQNPDKLTRIPVILPANIPELNFQIWFVCYRNGILYCRGNGQEGRRFENGQVVIVDCPCERINLPEGDPERCIPYGRLNCIPKYAKTFGGVWVFRTRSLRTIETLTRQLEYFHKIFEGVLSRFVFQLVLNREVAIINQKPQYVYTVSLLYDPEEDNFEDTVFYRIFMRVREAKEKENLAFAIEREKKMLEAYVQDIDRDELREEVVQEIKEEFFPEEEEQKIANELNERVHSAEKEVIQAQVVEPEPTAEEKADQTQVETVVQVKSVSVPKPADAKKAELPGEKVNKGQVIIIRRELTRVLGLSEDDPVLARVENLSFEDGTMVLRLIREGKHKEAYEKIKKAISGEESGVEPGHRQSEQGTSFRTINPEPERKTSATGTSSPAISPVIVDEEELFEELDDEPF